MNTRALAARVVTEVIDQGTSLTDALAQSQKQLGNEKDQALLQELCFGVIRWRWRFDAVLDQLMDRPLKARDIELKYLAMVGLYQLSNMRIPDHAAVAETVNACEDLKKTWAKKLLNALLRNYQRRSVTLADTLKERVDYQYSHPAWLINQIRKAWPEHWQQVLDANNQKPPMTLRVNQRKKQRSEYMQALMENQLTAEEFPFSDSGIILEKPVPVEQLPGFAQGWVSVQDGAAQLAAGLLSLASAKRVLDVCAAPGGKAAHILETAPQLQQLTALDVDPARLSKVREYMQRLELTANLVEGDARYPDQWWDKQFFDHILLDAPCSATGVIRRHPDIKQLRRPADIQQLVSLQAHILRSVWPLLSSGGILLYATCSILPEENEAQIGNFLQSQRDAQLVEFPCNWGMKQQYGWQVLPGQHQMDGFYYACMRKQ